MKLRKHKARVQRWYGTAAAQRRRARWSRKLLRIADRMLARCDFVYPHARHLFDNVTQPRQTVRVGLPSTYWRHIR